MANPYGAGQDLSRGQGAVTTFLHHAVNGQTITIWGDGNVIRDYVHISDVAQALVMLATNTTLAIHIFNIGSGVGISLNDIVVELEAQLQCKLGVMRTEGRPFDVPVSVLALDRATKSLGWTPRLSFGEGIQRTLIDLTNQTTFSTLD